MKKYFSSFFLFLILFSIPFMVSASAGYRWNRNQSTFGRNWNLVKMSADGTKLVSTVSTIYDVEDDRYIYTSDDGGVTWVPSQSAGLHEWKALSVSSNGQKIAAAETGNSGNRYIYTSDDGGVTWSTQTSAGSRKWIDLVGSSDGNSLAAVTLFDYIYLSTNGGLTWSTSTADTKRSWTHLDSSVNGTKLAATESFYIHTSLNGGGTWATSSMRLSSGSWTDISSNEDGSNLFATSFNSNILYKSTDWGVTWATSTISGASSLKSIELSPDGTKVILVDNNKVFVSTDGGVTFVDQIYPSINYGGYSESNNIDNTGVTTASRPTNSGDRLVVSASSNGLYVGIFDTTAPISSSVSTNITSSTFSLSFSTDERSATSTLAWGTPSLLTATSTVMYVLSPSFSLDNLVPCTRYKYSLSLSDTFFGNSTSSDSFFSTIGCPGNSDIATSTSSFVDNSIGGGISLEDITINMPSGFSTTSAVFQVARMDPSAIIASFGSPSSNEESIGAHTYQVSALPTATTSLSSFVNPITFTLSYNPSDVPSSVDPSTLSIYRNDGSGWSKLSCVVDTNVHTITCTTNSFSFFVLFGSYYSQATALNVGHSKPQSSRRIQLVSPIVITTPSSYSFPRNLTTGSSGEDVRSLQKFLNSKGFIVATKGAGSLGNETNFFGPATKKALIKFQKANGITPTVGYFGNVTRGVIQKY